MTTLFPYQEEGVAFLASRKAALLADDPGLGKTLQAIRAADKARALYVCVICPAMVVENWRREIQKYRQGDWSAFVTSYNRAYGSDNSKIRNFKWDVLIIDEAHYLKSPASLRTVKVYGKGCVAGEDSIVSRAEQVWLLTGTPMPNHPGELYPHLAALDRDKIKSPHNDKHWTYAQFQQFFCRMRATGFGMQVTGSKNEAELASRLSTFMLRRRKLEVLSQLPPLLFGEVFVEAKLDGVSSEEVETIRAALEKGGLDALRKIGTAVSTMRRVTGMAKVEPAVEWIVDWLQLHPAKKLVVFCHHRDVIRQIAARVKDKGFNTVKVYGGIEAPEVAIDAFQNDPSIRVFVGNIASAGVGITLTAASDLLFVEASWVPAEISQAAQRIHRIGQTEPCMVNFMMISGSIDEDIQRALSRKVESITKIIDGKSVE